MVKIVLACQNGASTSMLENRISQAVREQKLDAEIIAYPDSKLPDVIDQADVVLLGPQIGFKKEKIRAQFAGKRAVIEVINPVDYGMMDGAKVLKFALELYEKINNEGERK